MGENLEGRLAAIERRLEAAEDELAIHRLIVGYGLAVDTGDADAAADVFAETGVYDVDIGRMEGRAAVRAMVQGKPHQSMVGHCAHQIGPVVVQLDPPHRAAATGYSRVYLDTRAGTHIYRVSFNHWELVKRDGSWRIAHRLTRVLGHEEALGVFRSAQHTRGAQP